MKVILAGGGVINDDMSNTPKI